MGQEVVINNTLTIGDVLLVDTDRSFTGQDGQVVTPENSGTAVSGKLGETVFEMDLGVDHIFILQNQVAIRRPGGWDPGSVEKVEAGIRDFLLFY